MNVIQRLALVVLVLLFPLAAIATRAQDSECADLVKQALDLTRERCVEIGRDQVCYGNTLVDAEARTDIEIEPFRFAEPGDRADLSALRTLRLGAFSPQDKQWGVAYMRLRANLPDVAAGQFVTMLIVGDVEVREASEEVHDLFKTTGDLAQDAPPFTPMQAFYFRTGIGSGGAGNVPACREFPTDGVLLQTPKGAGKIQMVVNEVKLTFGSTIFLEAPGEPNTLGNLQTPIPGDPTQDPLPKLPNMVITSFEGEVIVEALGVTQIAAPGQQVNIQLDENSRPSAPPDPPVYNDPLRQAALTNFALDAGEAALIELREPDPTATLEPSPTPTPTRLVFLPPPPTNTPVPTATPEPPPPPPPPTLGPVSVVIVSGNGQVAVVGTAFAARLQARVLNANGTGVSGVTVRFRAPEEGPSGTFASTGTYFENAVTGPDGVATSSTFTADTIAGTYQVNAQETAIGPSVDFTLTNISAGASSIVAVVGTPQSATVGTAFAAQLQAVVWDAFFNPVPGVSVTFTAPAAGASGTFAGSGTNSETVVTDANGIATASIFTANTTVGSYTVTAVSGALSADFNLTNTAGAPASITATGGTPQTATVGTAFAAQLQATVLDAFNNPVPGVNVTFTAPAAGASGTFAGSGTNVISVVTDASGNALSTVFTANGTAGGPYTVTASYGGPGASFSLTNAAGAPASLSIDAGDGQAANINTAFVSQLIVTVRDAFNNPVPGASVTFTAPAFGGATSAASGTFAGSGTNTHTVAANASGQAASTVFTANCAAGGPYTVSATSGAAPPANFSLTNTGAPPNTVTCPNDNGPGTLRNVFAAAGAGSTIGFDASVGTVALVSPITIDKNITINGNGARVTTLSGSNATRLFTVNGGVTVTIQNVTLADGNATEGSAVYTDGALTLFQVTVRNHTTTGPSGAVDGNTGSLTINRCTLSNNSGRAIWTNIATTTIVNSTIANNSGDGLANYAVTNIYNSTFAGNGVGIFQGAGIPLPLRNVIIANNGTNCTGNPVTNTSSNIQFADSSCAGVPVADPQLGPLANNGGPTDTMLPGGGGAAINAGDGGVCTSPPVNSADQRGQPRGSPCDIGAVEVP